MIYDELTTLDYNFTSKAEYSFQKPLVMPFTDTTTLLAQLDEAVANGGFGRIEDAQRTESFQQFYDRVRPKLTMI